MTRTATVLSAMLLFLLIVYSEHAYAKSVPADDITTHISDEVQDSQSRALALPSGLGDNSLSLYDNPARMMDVSGLFLEGYAQETNVWGGTVISLPWSLKAGIFFRRPLSENSPLRNCLVEPGTGVMSPFSSMVNSGSTSLGIIDPTSIYFNSNTAFPNKSVSDLTTGDGYTKGFGNIDFFQGKQIGLFNVGLMESFSNSSNNHSETLSDGSTRGLSYSATEERISAGVSTSRIGFLTADFSVTYALHSLAFDYDASTSSTFPIVGFNNLSESVHCKSDDNSEMGIFFRTIFFLDNGMKVYGTVRYARYNMPLDVSGKLGASASPDTQTVQYNTSYSALSCDAALHQTVSQGCTIIYSLGYTNINLEYTKRTDVAPSSSDGSIWGNAPINDASTRTIQILPVGVAAEYVVNGMITARAGLRKYLWAPTSLTYTGSTGTLVTSSSEKEEFASGDQFFASAGVSILISKSIRIDIDIDASNNEFSQTGSKSSSVAGGVSLHYLF